MESVAWTFEGFTLLAERRLLMHGGATVRLGGRALDILVALVECAGRFVSRDDLIHRTWGGRIVEEINLRVQVAALRRALGDDGADHPRFILNVPARGYCFIAPVDRRTEFSNSPPEGDASKVLASHLPALVGRESIIVQIRAQIPSCRTVTVVGPGGVGKSAVALKVAASRHASDVCHVDLGGLDDMRIAIDRIAAMLGDTSDRPPDTEGIVHALRDCRMLLLLDGCEGVVDGVAMLAEAVLARAPGVHLLATSREPLRIPGEQVHRLAPLDVPTAATPATLESALSWPSVLLLSERAHAASGNFDPSPHDAPIMMELCRRLDGIPLAIELAAHRIEHLGLSGVLEQLEQGFDMLSDERRTEVPRQQSLRASFDWSFHNLAAEEQDVLCWLSVFDGDFSLATGAKLASQDGNDAQARELIGQLATKSLVSVDSSSGAVRYRLLATTRDFARMHLSKRGDHASTRRRHAELTAALLEAADAEQADHSSQDWLARHVGALGDLRAAFDWTATTPDEGGLQMRLLAASVRLLYQLSAVAEYRERADAILAAPCAPVSDSSLIRVQFALGRARLHLSGQDADSSAAFEQAFAAAQRSGDHRERMAAIWGLWLDHCLGGRYAEALDSAHQHERLAAGTENGSGIAVDRMLLASFLNTGQLAEARVRGERALASIFLMPFTSAGARPHLEEDAIARTHLARVLWLQGLPDRALAMAGEAVDTARLSTHDIATCLCLHGLCVIALWTGHPEEAKQAALELARLAMTHRLEYWAAWARSHLNAVAFANGAPLPPDWREPLCGAPQLEIMATFCTRLLEPELVLRADAGQAPWCEAEVLRARGCQAMRMQTAQGRQQALVLFERALQVARAQGALAWELRVATSTAAIWHQDGATSDTIDLLAQTLGRFTQGFTTPDFREAADLLEKMRSR